METIYKLSNIKKTYDKNNIITHALNDVDLEINKGEMVIVLGPSGSGKSTMLNMLSGIDNPTSGIISFKTEDISKYNEDELTNYRRSNLGFIFQSYNLIFNLTVRENIELGLNTQNSPFNIDKIIDDLGLKNHKNKFPYQLSGGQMQRVAIGRAIVKNPNVLFCDEPTGALDEEMGKQILELLQNINKTYKTTIIIVTHNPAISKIGNKIIKLNSGKIISITKNKRTISAKKIRWA